MLVDHDNMFITLVDTGGKKCIVRAQSVIKAEADRTMTIVAGESFAVRVRETVTQVAAKLVEAGQTVL